MARTLEKTRTQTFTIIDCCCCGAPFGVLDIAQAEWRRTGQLFYCPAGHGQQYKETETDRIRAALSKSEEDLALEKRYAARLEADLNAADATVKKTKRELSTLKRRAKAGVCPCCNRTFIALGRHMRSKHPEFDPEG